MKVILTAAGHYSKLEEEVRADSSGDFAQLIGYPKALFPGPGPGPSLSSLGPGWKSP